MTRSTLLLIALALAGVSAAGLDAARRAPLRPDPGAPWVLLDPEGAPGSPAVGGRPTLPAASSIALRDAAPHTVRRARLDATPAHERSALELRWRHPDGTERVVRLTRRLVQCGSRKQPNGPIHATDGVRAPDGTVYFKAGVKLTLEATVDAGVLSVRCDDRNVLRVAFKAPSDRFEVTARADDWRLRGFYVEGRVEMDGGKQPLALSTDFTEALPPARPAAAAGRLGTCLLLALLAAALLRTLCATRPTAAELARATGSLLAPAALLVVMQVAAGGSPALPGLAAAGAVGLLPALFVLRDRLGTTGLEPVPAGWTALGLAALAASAWVAGDWDARLHAEERRHEARALALPEPSRWLLPRDIPLDRRNAIRAEGAWRDARTSLRVTIEPGGIFQVRTRGTPDGKEYGVSLYLSTDPRFESGFYEEGRTRFERIGAAAGTVPAGEPLEVRLTTRGRSFAAKIGQEPFATGSCRRHPRGHVTLLAAHGRATLQGAEVAPLDRSDAAAEPATTVSATPDRRRGAIWPVLFVAAYVLLLTRGRRVPLSRPLVAGALALLPLTITLPGLSPAGAMDNLPLAAAGAASAILLLLLPTVQSPAVGRLRHAGAVALVLAAGVLLLSALLERAWPPTTLERNAIAIDGWEGDRLERDLLHLTHPLVRRWHRYLGDHELRGRRPTLAPEDGRPRVLFLGTSSTYGYRVRVPYGFHVERLLSEAGRRVEAVVGAVEGSAGARLFHVLENTLAAYRPDVLVLSLGFNDSVALAQIDERAYLERITAPGYRRGLVERWTTRARFWLASRQLATAMEHGAAELYEAIGTDDDRPADRFERVLRAYASFAAERGIDVVFVKEPFDEARMGGLRPQQQFGPGFHAAMDRVAEEFGLRVVDPWPYLDEHGGGALFLDPVHPTEVGHERMAEALLPTLNEVLDAREAR